VKRSLIWFLAPIMAVMLTACEEVPEGNASTGGTATTEEGVEISLGTGEGDSFSAGSMTAAVTSLSAGGTSSIAVNLVDVANSNSLYSGVPVEVEFESQCVASGKATFTNATIVTSTGTAATTYQAEGCVGSDTITAKYDTATAAVSVTVSPADVNSVGFTGTGFAASIAYGNSATGSQPNFSATQFALIDDRGNPVEGQTVTFAISSADSQHAATLSNTTDISDEDGFVETRVNAGTAAANIRVTATFTPSGGTAISTQSLPIAINTGPADHDSFSLAISDAAVKNAYGTDGVTTTMSVQVGDRHNNPVADGTVVSFWAEYGHIQPSCETSGGNCSATWTSGGMRPGDGLATVIAYTTGEDSFLDAGERNGIYNIAADSTHLSVDEAIINTSEMYYDYASDGYTAGTDAFVDYNGNGIYDATSTKYRGALCSVGAIAASHCAETSVQVWSDSQIALNTRTPVATLMAGPWIAGGTYTITVVDSLGNYPPADSSVSLSAISPAAADLTISGNVPSVGFAGASAHTFTVTVNAVTAAGTHKVNVAFPDGNTAPYSIVINP